MVINIKQVFSLDRDIYSEKVQQKFFCDMIFLHVLLLLRFGEPSLSRTSYEYDFGKQRRFVLGYCSNCMVVMVKAN